MPLHRDWKRALYTAHPETTELLDVSEDPHMMVAVVLSWSGASGPATNAAGAVIPGGVQPIRCRACKAWETLGEMRAEAQQLGLDIAAPSLKTKAQLSTAIKGARNTGEVRDRTKDPETAATSSSMPRNSKTAPTAARPTASAIPKAVPITPPQELEATRTRLQQLEADLELQRQELAMGRQQFGEATRTRLQELEATRTRLQQLEADLELQRQELAMGRQQFDEQREQHQQEVLAAWEILAAAGSRLAQEQEAMMAGRSPFDSSLLL